MKPDAPNPGGRPRKAEGEGAEATLHIRCRKEDKARWTNKARAEGRSLSEWILEKIKKSEAAS